MNETKGLYIGYVDSPEGEFEHFAFEANSDIEAYRNATRRLLMSDRKMIEEYGGFEGDSPREIITPTVEYRTLDLMNELDVEALDKLPNASDLWLAYFPIQTAHNNGFDTVEEFLASKAV